MRVSTLDDLCAVIGYTATRIIAAWYPGRQLYVPMRADPAPPLARLIGFPALRALGNFGTGGLVRDQGGAVVLNGSTR